MPTVIVYELGEVMAAYGIQDIQRNMAKISLECCVIVTFADIVRCCEATKITIIIVHYVFVHLCCIKFSQFAKIIILKESFLLYFV